MKFRFKDLNTSIKFYTGWCRHFAAGIKYVDFVSRHERDQS